MAAGKRVSGSSSEAEAGAEAGAHGPGTRSGDPETRARQICLRLLTAEPRTRAQLAQALQRRGVPDDAAEAVLSRFTEAGLIDDASFARAWVESRHHSRGLSRRSLSAELRRRGVDSEEIREAVDTLDPEQEAATARRLVEHKLASTRGQSPEARARRTASLLARKGYPPGLAFRLIREVMQEEGAADVIDLDAEPYIAPEDETPEDELPDLGWAGAVCHSPAKVSVRRAWFSRRVVRVRSLGGRSARRSPRSHAGRSSGHS
jgi:SOS response regulatory protein OraA/RecX